MLELLNLTKSFDSKLVLQGVSLTIPAGKTVVLLGPSGCGKTTLLRLVAGLETADSGRVNWHTQNITQTPIHQRGFGMVFQDYALFPHKNVQQNIAFGLRMQKQPPAQITQRVNDVLHLVGLTGFANRDIHDLSGGEQQRVALARALAPAPSLLLLDEPLGALDRALRERLMLELRRILSQTADLTALYVTHDQAEAFAIADLIAVMNEGRIEQLAEPAQLYARPGTPFVARFLGMENILPATPTATPTLASTPLGQLQLAHPIAQPTQLLIRPDAGQLEGTVNGLTGRVTARSFRGRYQLITLTTHNYTLKLEFDGATHLPAIGEEIKISLNPAGIQTL